MTSRTVAAVDVGASSGRVMLATVSEDSLDLREVHRFANGGVRVGGELQWDVLALYAGVLEGLRLAAREVPRLDAVGIDTWAVDYGLLDADGRLLGNPVHYRDRRTDGVGERVAERSVGRASCTRAPGSRTCRSTPSTSWWPSRAPHVPVPRGPCCCCPTCWPTGSRAAPTAAPSGPR